MKIIVHNWKPVFLTIAAAMVIQLSFAQNSETVQSYINTYKELAISEMQRTGVPASITLAQGIHESGAGTSDLVQASNNHFGIKCKSTWTGESVRHDDDARAECFRKYPQPADSYKDHSDFLKNGQRYAFLFELDPTDYEGWATGLKKAGYATNPKYPALLIKLIEDYKLQNYTLIAMGKMRPNDLASTSPFIDSKKSDSEYNNIEEQPKKIEASVIAKQVSYPTGDFTIHETKVIFANKGTSFLAIANQYNVPLARLFDFNDMAPAEEMEKDQLIFLQRKRRSGKNEFHVVQPGETLHDIAQVEAIRLEALKELNWLKNDDFPAPGEQLSLRSKANKSPKLALRENYSLTPFKNNHTGTNR